MTSADSRTTKCSNFRLNPQTNACKGHEPIFYLMLSELGRINSRDDYAADEQPERVLHRGCLVRDSWVTAWSRIYN